MGFWDEIKESIKESIKEGFDEGIEEGRAELAEEEARKQAGLDAEKEKTMQIIAGIPYEEQFAMCLAAPFRVTLFYDWYTIFKDDQDDDELYPLHLYTFGDGVDLTSGDVKNIMQYIKRDFGIKNREQAIYQIKALLYEADIPACSELFSSIDGGFCEGYEPTGFLLTLQEPDMEWAAKPLRILMSSMISLILTSSADAGYITKDEAMDVLADVNCFVRNLLTADPTKAANWESFADAFLLGEEISGMNGKKGRKVLEQFVGYLINKPGSPWNNVPFEKL